jgi:hypothetical protein
MNRTSILRLVWTGNMNSDWPLYAETTFVCYGPLGRGHMQEIGQAEEFSC